MSKANLTGRELDVIANWVRGIALSLNSLAKRNKFPDKVNTESYQVGMAKSPAKVTKIGLKICHKNI